MSNVIPLGMVTRLDMPVEKILDAVSKQDLDGVVILGYDKEGDIWFSSSYADGGTVLWLLERAKKDLLAVGEES